MSKYLSTIKRASKNKIVHYVFSRYATYLIQFINSLFIAIYLGPYYLGVWGFVTLVINYLAQINFGISHSVNAIIAVKYKHTKYIQYVIGASIVMIVILSIGLILFFSLSGALNFQIGVKYHFNQFIPIVLAIAILGHINSLLNNIFRVHGRLFEIAFNQSSVPILMLFAIILFKKDELLWALVISNAVASFLSFVVYFFSFPIKIKLNANTHLMARIQKRGWHLFLYNSSFYLIIISTRSFISSGYSVEEFGFFTFSFALANTVLLLLQSIDYLIYPKLLNRFAKGSVENINTLLNYSREIYITSSHFIAHLVILFFPLFLLLFPQYEQSSKAFKLIVLTIALYSNSYGYTSLLIAKGKEKILGYIALSALMINIGLSILMINYFNVPFHIAIVATMITYFLYGLFTAVACKEYLDYKHIVSVIYANNFPFRIAIPYFISLIFIVCNVPDNLFFTPLILFIIFNLKIMTRMYDLINKVIANPNFINI